MPEEKKRDAAADEAERGGRDEPEPKKERVLHTRIPAVLEDELKRAASSLRVPVSNLVRTILEDAVAAAQAVGRAAEEELRGAAERLGDERERLRRRAEASGKAVGRAAAEARADEVEENEGDDHHEAEREASGDPLEGVLGFQPLVLAIDARCTVCGEELTVGSDAFLGLREGVGSRVIVHQGCVPGRKNDED